MKKIMIVEDDVITMKILVEEANKVNSDIMVISADSEKQALELAKKNDIAAFFIDIQLIDSDGISLAKNLRCIDKYTFVPMVFITGVPTKELEAFRQIHCYDYILKPFSKEMISKIFKKTLIDYFSLPSAKENKLVLEFKGYNQLVKMKDIVYIRHYHRKIKIYTTDNCIDYKHETLKKFTEKLSCSFKRVHQSFIVNENYVTDVDHESSVLYLNNNDKQVPIGVNYKEEVGDMLNESY